MQTPVAFVSLKDTAENMLRNSKNKYSYNIKIEQSNYKFIQHTNYQNRQYFKLKMNLQ